MPTPLIPQYRILLAWQHHFDGRVVVGVEILVEVRAGDHARGAIFWLRIAKVHAQVDTVGIVVLVAHRPLVLAILVPVDAHLAALGDQPGGFKDRNLRCHLRRMQCCRQDRAQPRRADRPVDRRLVVRHLPALFVILFDHRQHFFQKRIDALALEQIRQYHITPRPKLEQQIVEPVGVIRVFAEAEGGC